MNAQRWIRRVVAVALVGASTVVVAATSSPVAPVAAQTSALGAGGEYHPLAPARIFDSRTAVNDSAPLGLKPTSPQGLTFNVDILGQGGIPAEVGGVNTQVLAVVANVTVVGSTLDGFLSMYPTGAAPGESSLVNFAPSEAVPNLAVLGIGTGGQSTISLVTPQGAGTAHVLIDVFGWISTSQFADTADSGARFRPIPPSRLLDTRSTPVPAGWPTGKPIGTMEQLMVTPLRPMELILGKTLPFAAIGLVQLFVITAVAMLLFDVPLRGNPLLLVLASICFLGCSLGAGLFISTISNTQQQAMMTTFFFFQPAFMLSGFSFPIRNMPEVVQWITYVNPMRYFMEVVRGIFLKGVGLEVLWPQILALAVLGGSILTASALRFHKRLD